MKLRLEENITQSELEVLIRYAKLTPTVDRLVAMVKAFDETICCHTGEEEVWVSTGDIFYVESVDKKTFAYTEKQVYRTSQRLYQLLEILEPVGFVQVSKFCLLNTNVLQRIHALSNSRMEATLQNGERVGISRKYIPMIKKKLLER